jgi:hypothetical protein
MTLPLLTSQHRPCCSASVSSCRYILFVHLASSSSLSIIFVMLIATILEVSLALSLFAQVIAVSPPEKHPIRPEIDLNVALPTESFVPSSTPESQEPLAHDAALKTQFDPTNSDQTLAASSSSRSRKDRWQNTATRQASLANLGLGSAKKRREAYRIHLITAADFESRPYSSLDEQEKNRVFLARNYFRAEAKRHVEEEIIHNSTMSKLRLRSFRRFLS